MQKPEVENEWMNEQAVQYLPPSLFLKEYIASMKEVTTYKQFKGY